MNSKSSVVRAAIAGIILALLVPFIAEAVPVGFDWGSFNSSGSTAYGVYDSDCSTILAAGDLVQFLWAGPDGQISEPPTRDGAPTGDDQLLQTSVVVNVGSLPPPMRNKGYVPFTTFTIDSLDPKIYPVPGV